MLSIIKAQVIKWSLKMCIGVLALWILASLFRGLTLKKQEVFKNIFKYLLFFVLFNDIIYLK